jgi:hypothetical protein
VKPLASALAPACALLALAAPAAAAPERRPGPVDFELTPPQAPRAAGVGDVVSRAVRAPRRFNLVGVRWRGHSEARLELRVRRDGRGWSRWQALAAEALGGRAVVASEPVWVGEADRVQYRLDRPVPGLRLHFVDVGRTARSPATRPAAASARAGEPPFVSRREWGAATCPPRRAPGYGTVRAVHVHHTVSLSDYTRAEAPGIVLAICRYHRNSNGWNDIGYQALVDRFGVLYEGRAGGLDRPVIGAHAQGFNAQSSGVASIGDNTAVGLSDAALDALAGYIGWKLAVHGQPLSGRTTLVSAGGATSRFAAGRSVRVPRVLGHRDTNLTSCPGDALYAQLEDLRARVASGTPLPGAPTTLTAALSATRTAYGTPVTAYGTLGSALGVPLAGVPVRLEALRGGRWRVLAQPLTDAAGGWSATIVPHGSRLLRATFAGDLTWRRAWSAEMPLRVTPRVTLGPTAATGVRGARVRVAGRVTPGKRLVYQVLQQRIAGVYRRVGVRAVPARGGRFRSWFAPGFTGLYRFYVVARADSATARGRSPARVLRVTRR